MDIKSKGQSSKGRHSKIIERWSDKSKGNKKIRNEESEDREDENNGYDKRSKAGTTCVHKFPPDVYKRQCHYWIKDCYKQFAHQLNNNKKWLY